MMMMMFFFSRLMLRVLLVGRRKRMHVNRIEDYLSKFRSIIMSGRGANMCKRECELLCVCHPPVRPPARQSRAHESGKKIVTWYDIFWSGTCKSKIQCIIFDGWLKYGAWEFWWIKHLIPLFRILLFFSLSLGEDNLFVLFFFCSFLFSSFCCCCFRLLTLTHMAKWYYIIIFVLFTQLMCV